MSHDVSHMAWPAPAKLNLFLHITGRREDGYHLLQSVFQFVDYGDELYFSVRGDGRIQRCGTLSAVPEEQDLTVRAARLLQAHTGTGLGAEIQLEKKLPMGGGLGGGSSDAATTLVALNCLWKCGLDTDALAALGLQLGADVPVFVRGHAAWAEGVGEKLTPVDLPEPWYVVLVPPVNISTVALFSHSQLRRDCPAITIRAFLSQAGRESIGNVFEPLVRREYPEVDAAWRQLSEFAPARMTGTGACVFAAFDDEAAARRAWAMLADKWCGFVAKGMNRSPLYQRLNVKRSE